MARAPPPFDVSDLNSTSRLLEIMDLNDHHRQNRLHHHHQQPPTRMEDMDIEVMDVPDTPDRWIAPKSKRGGDDVVEVDSSNSGRSRLWDKPVRNSFREQGKLANPNRSNRLFSRPQGGISILNESEEDTNPAVMMLDSPPSSMSSFRKMMAGKQIPTRPRSTEFARPSNDRTKVDSNGSAFTEVLASDDKVQERNKAKVDSLVSNQGISSDAMNCFGSGSMRKKIAIQGHSDEGVSDVPMDHGKGVDLQGDVKQKGELNTSKSQHLTASPRTNGHRRLVRNGCISPLNIAKNKHTVESTGKNSSDDSQKAIPNCRIQASEGSHTDSINGGKGKEVVGNLPHAQEYYTDTIRSSNRRSLNPMEEVNVNEDASGGALRPRELMGGWISTRHRSRTVAGARSHEVRDPVPFQQEPTACSVHGSSSIVPDLDRNDGAHRVSGNLGKRQRKRNPTSSNFGECSSSIFDGSEVAFVRPLVEPSNARLVPSRNNCHHDRSAPVIDIDEFSPGVSHRSPQITTQVVDDDSYARARQLEADEKLARELQEQFYQLPEMGGGETDASLAWTFQQEEERRRASSRGRQRVHPRDSSMSHLYRSQFQNSIVRSANRVNRGANRGRAPSMARPARLRDRFLGHSPSVSARARGLQFPPNMDVEMRIHILEMLEASAGENDGMTNLLQVQRDFNENDYEMLLALDDGNHQHGGASSSQINGLPQSTVQSDNFDEACSICLETPTIGDTIRHLPCLHKFHKDCIDPWLRRKTSCPVCKSGIT